MTSKPVYVFTCAKCQNVTPVFVKVDSGGDPRPVRLHDDCHHCGEHLVDVFESAHQLLLAIDAQLYARGELAPQILAAAAGEIAAQRRKRGGL